MSEVTVNKSIDARGAYCPGPLMELVKGIKTAQVGEVVEVLSTDKGSAVDIPEWVNKMGHEIVYTESEGEEFRIAVRKVK
ncbi:sulfurtransferase TusA family protein [Bacillus sp. REN3]|uniref:sulfurtransferase TusA family protein n=1 Tax=Bacillus sp. REN3 TaxID=2802440 RepID=UPI001AEF029D|nr:sulfurtransferase TusA family protein [Bacillus sp. REN3]